MMQYLIIFTSVLIAGCTTSGNDTDGKNKLTKDISELNAAPESVVIENNTYVIEPYVWRDLMPVINPKDKQGLFLSIKVKSKDGTAVDEKIKASTAWITKDTEIWETPIIATEVKDPSFIEFYARNGPDLKSDQKVNVIIELYANNKKYLLQAKDQIIQAVY
jgi:hypothetical protein